MQKYQDSVLNSVGGTSPAAGASVYVLLHGTQTQASLFSDNAGIHPITNPVTTDVGGFFGFYAANGHYDLQVVYNGEVVNRYDIILLDPAAPNTQGFALIDGGPGNPASFSGFLQAGTGAQTRPWNDKAKESVSINDFRTASDTDITAFNKATAALVSNFGGGTLILPSGSYSINGVTVPSNVSVQGNGYVTITSPSSNPIFSLSGSHAISGIRFVGFGSGTLDQGFVANGISDVSITGCYFTNFRKQPIRVTGISRFSISGNTFKDNFGSDSGVVTSSAESDIAFVDNCDAFSANNNLFFANASRPKQIAIFISAQTSNAKWTNATFNGNIIEGYSRGGIYPDDETAYTSVNSAYCTIANNVIVNSGQEAIKSKNVWFMTITGNVINGFELISQEIFGNLQGGIFVNSGPGSVVSGNTIIGIGSSCTNAIQIAGSTPVTWTYDAPLTRYGVSVVGNNMYNCGREAILLSQVSQASVSGNQAFNCAAFINAQWSSANPTFINNNLSITGNTYRGIGFGGASAALPAVSIFNVVNALFADNLVVDCGANGITLDTCQDTTISNCLVFNAGRIGSSFNGIRINNCTNTRITGTTSSNRDSYTGQVYGLQIAGTNTGVAVFNCDLTGNTTSAVDPASTIASDTFMSDINGYLRNTVTWTPGTIANNAQTNQGIGIAGAAVGDFVQVTAPYDLLGATVTAYVTSTNNARIIVANNSGASITLASGTWKVRIIKRPS